MSVWEEIKGGEATRFVRTFWKEWYEREKKLESEHMCMHNHSDAHQWQPLGSSEKGTSKQICKKCLEIRDWFFYRKRK